MKNLLSFAKAAACISLVVPTIVFAQQPSELNGPSAYEASTSTSPDAAVTPSSSSAVRTAASAASPQDVKSLTSRWLDLEALSHSERYRNSYNQGGFRNFDAGQERNLVEGRIKLDEEGRYFIGVRASSGRYFNWAYAEFAGESRTDRVNAAALNGVSAAARTTAENKEVALAKVADPAGLLVSKTYSNGWEFYVREL